MADPQQVTEYGLLMSDGGYQIRWGDPEVEKIYPTSRWASHQIRYGCQVFRRKVIVVEDWAEIGDAAEEWPDG